ncbi:MAG: RNA degradosome polyphosphate kinase, partial [Lachnospiraceae bacterium]|nr:RNA degradosome polyphosphate kinase [Lachnospiraceae bacterium]
MPDKFLDYKNFLNRELSWLEFEDRVLNEASDETNLLFERLKFLGITSSNLDEFFMIRVATMKHLLNEDNSLLDIAGYSPKKQLELISERAHILVDRQCQVYIKQKLNLLEEGIKIANCLEDLSKSGQKKARDFFKDFLLTMLTPIMVDSSRPFPRIKSRTINIFILLKTPYSSNEEVGIVSIPESLDRLMCVSEENHEFILLEDLIYDSLVGLYPDYEIVSKGI